MRALFTDMSSSHSPVKAETLEDCSMPFPKSWISNILNQESSTLTLVSSDLLCTFLVVSSKLMDWLSMLLLQNLHCFHSHKPVPPSSLQSGAQLAGLV